MKKILWFLFIIACISCSSMKPLLLGIDPNNTKDNPTLSGWMDFNKLLLTFNPERSDYLFLTFERYRNNDEKIDIESSKQKGTVLVVNDQYMLTLGLDLRPGFEIDILDRPLLTRGLVLKLLYSSFLKGPPTKQGAYPIDHIDNFHSLHVSTRSTSEDYLAPWDIKGNIDCIEPGVLSFKFSANFNNEKRPWEIRGEWIAQATISPFTDEMSLDGWEVYKLGHFLKDIKDEKIDVFGATHVSDFKTLGEIREASKSSKDSNQREQAIPLKKD